MNSHRLGQGHCRLMLIATLAVTAALVTDDCSTPFDPLEWRAIGPVNMSGRVADMEGVPGDPNVLQVGSASGGAWKTGDGGLTFEPILDDQPIAAIGDLALAPTHRSRWTYRPFEHTSIVDTVDRISLGNSTIMSLELSAHER